MCVQASIEVLLANSSFSLVPPVRDPMVSWRRRRALLLPYLPASYYCSDISNANLKNKSLGTHSVIIEGIHWAMTSTQSCEIPKCATLPVRLSRVGRHEKKLACDSSPGDCDDEPSVKGADETWRGTSGVFVDPSWSVRSPVEPTCSLC